MRAFKVTVIGIVTLALAGGTMAGEGADRARLADGPFGFVPGPPLWQRPELRPEAKRADTLEQTVDLCVSEAMSMADTPGASVAVIVDGELVYRQGYGVKRRGGSEPVDADTQFRVGSVTKMFTAAAVMQQVEAGTVSLDDRLDRFVPEAAFQRHWPAEEITVRRLLTHATGIPDLPFNPAGVTDPDGLARWAANLSQVGLHAPPGAFYNYSNPNFNLAGLVVERATGIRYRAYMESRVLGPAGLTDTTFDPAAVVARGNASDGHMPDGNGGEAIYAPDDYDNVAFAPAGYLFSTAGDLVRWALLLSDGGGDVLSASSAAAMQRGQQSMEILPGYDYGFGIFIEPFYDLTVRQHGGNIWGWGAYLLWHREQRFAVAVLANTFQSLPGAAYCIADAVLEPNHAAAPHYPPTDPERLELFEGYYDATVGTALSFVPYPVMGEVFGDSLSELSIHLWDPAGGWSALWDLDHVAHDLFLVDFDWDGTPDFDVSFLTSDGQPEQTRWLRMRPIVGYPQHVPRSGGRIIP